MKRYTFMSDGYYAISGEENFDDQDENYCGAAIDKLAYYENMEEQGKLLILPCKIGDPVWLVEPTECNGYGCPYQGDYGNWRCKVNGKEQCKPFVYEKPFDYGMIGRKFYLTREYAEVALSKKA